MFNNYLSLSFQGVVLIRYEVTIQLSGRFHSTKLVISWVCIEFEFRIFNSSILHFSLSILFNLLWGML